MQTLLIITNSFDLTTDLLLDKLEGQSVFRLNFDQFSRYKLRMDRKGFDISDPIGRSISSTFIHKAYWRTPFNAPAEEEYAREPFVDAELRYVLSEIVNFLWMKDQLVLVEPYAERRSGKLVQLRYAEQHFAVPEYAVSLNSGPRQGRMVVKSLSSALVGGAAFFTTRVDTSALSLRFPWFVEAEIVARADVTIVFVRGKLFSYSLERSFLDEAVDWRQSISPMQEWHLVQIPSDLACAIRDYMQVLRLDYGRLDFLLDDDGHYWFCEVNPNGQFAWLDLQDRDGLLSAVASEISSETSRHSIPHRHPVSGRIKV